VLEKLTHNARGEIVDLYTTWQWPTLCEAIDCLPSSADTLGTSSAPASLHPANDGTEVVEAVGIEPSSVHPVSHDSVAITRNGLDAGTPLKPSESVLRGPLGTRVPNKRWSDAWFVQLRHVWGTLRVV
jgi:hypothetical protein